MSQELQPEQCYRWALQIATISIIKDRRDNHAFLAAKYTRKALLEEVVAYFNIQNVDDLSSLGVNIPVDIVRGIHDAAAADSYETYQEEVTQQLEMFSI